VRVITGDPRLRAGIELALAPAPGAGLIVTSELDGVGALRDADPAARVVVVAIRRSQVGAALDAGADMALDGPLRAAELRARVRALERAGGPPSNVGPLTLDRGGRTAALDGVPLRLPPREFSLLCCLACVPGRVFSKHELLESCWGTTVSTSRTLERHAARLRGRLGRHGPMLVTVWGVGYRLDVPA
jgi:DNA-binding response OmpR family regulator